MSQNRLKDQHKRISEFQTEVLVACPQYERKANTQADYKEKRAREFCANCGYNKTCSTEVTVLGAQGNWQLAVHAYFDATLWLTYPFKQDIPGRFTFIDPKKSS